MMRFFSLARYFFFLASKWNIGIAWHILIEEIRGERRYKLKTTGFDKLKSLAAKGIDTSHATIYMPASYDMLELVFSALKDQQLQHFVDLGCGRGRAMAVAAHFGFTKITGIEFSEQLSDQATKNLSSTGKRIPGLQWNVINADVRSYNIPNDADCIFIFNPFDEVVLTRVIHNIERSLRSNPRNIHVIYLTPHYRHIFDMNGYKIVKQIRIMEFLDGIIYSKGFTA